MRKMKNKQFNSTINVVEHIILQNFWEYYVTDYHFNKKDYPNIVNCLVMGDEIEQGDVNLDEIKPYIISRTKVDKNSELMPAQGYEWVD